MIDPQWFAGQGWSSVLVAATFFAGALLTLLWLREPGSRPHDPPVAHDMVRQLSATLALFGGFWLVRAITGIGGMVIFAALLLTASLIRTGRARARRRQ